MRITDRGVCRREKMATIRIFIPLFLALAMQVPALADESDDKVRWSWRCASSRFYKMEATPDGSAKPSEDGSSKAVFQIIVKEMTPQRSELCGSGRNIARYYLRMVGDPVVEQFGTDRCFQFTHADVDVASSGSGYVSEIERLSAVTLERGPQSVVISKDDQDWRFILSSTNITTQQASRRAYILIPGLKKPFPPEAGIWFITGSCFLESGG